MAWQGDLFDFANVSLITSSDGVSRASVKEESQVSTANIVKRALKTTHLIEEIASFNNLQSAVKRVKRNKGGAGIDRMSVGDLVHWFEQNWYELQKSLIGGTFKPTMVLGAEIPKDNGGVRQLGIPTVIDRVVQQAILQVLEKIYEPQFSEYSYGFRPKKSAHGALLQASKNIKQGKYVIVDIDLAKFFDEVNHDILMERLSRKISDKTLLKLIRRFLQAGIMLNGISAERKKGTPQGGPLSPLLANILLDELDKELEQRDLAFVRYADDVQIYVGSNKAGERVMKSVTNFIEQRLKLKVNHEKSKVTVAGKAEYLGYTLGKAGRLFISKKSLNKAKDKIRFITKRSRGHVTFMQMVNELNSFLGGWMNYFKLAEAKTKIIALGEWMRRKLRCVTVKRLKRAKGIARWLMKRGIKRDEAWKLAGSSKGYWRKSMTPQMSMAMSNSWLLNLGLIDLAERWANLKH